MTISDASISVDVFDTVRTLIVNAAVATTASTAPQTVTAVSVNAVYNDKTPARPQIVINPARITESDYKFGGSVGKRFINVLVDCYGSNTLQVDQMSDQVVACMETSIAGMDLVGFASDYAFSSPGDLKFHLKSISFSYIRE